MGRGKVGGWGAGGCVDPWHGMARIDERRSNAVSWNPGPFLVVRGARVQQLGVDRRLATAVGAYRLPGDGSGPHLVHAA